MGCRFMCISVRTETEWPNVEGVNLEHPRRVQETSQRLTGLPGDQKTCFDAGGTPTGGGGTRVPNGQRTDEGDIPNGLLLPPEKHSGPPVDGTNHLGLA